MVTAAEYVLRTVVTFLPVCLFLASLAWLDSYKLMRLRMIFLLIGAGVLAGVFSFVLNRLVSHTVSPLSLTRYLAPAIEETFKGLTILYLIKRKRIGFLVDAAIAGFAIGTGFALIENLYYVRVVEDAPLILWIVRGFGTAVMHGGTQAIFAVTAKVATERKESERLYLFAIPWLLAWVIHSAFNHFVLSPILTTLLIVFTLPLLFILIFAESEKFLQSWLGRGFDLDGELIQAIRSNDFTSSRAGRYLVSLKEHFDGPVVADMLCYLRIRTELSLRAKGILLLRESGLPVKRDPEIDARLKELTYLQKSIGRTGEMALAPIISRSSRDLWEINMLTKIA